MLKKKAAEMKMFWEDDGQRGDMIHGLQVLHSCALPQGIGMRPICVQSSDSRSTFQNEGGVGTTGRNTDEEKRKEMSAFIVRNNNHNRVEVRETKRECVIFQETGPSCSHIHGVHVDKRTAQATSDRRTSAR